jgi:hypothetical protein
LFFAFLIAFAIFLQAIFGSTDIRFYNCLYLQPISACAHTVICGFVFAVAFKSRFAAALKSCFSSTFSFYIAVGYRQSAVLTYLFAARA